MIYKMIQLIMFSLRRLRRLRCVLKIDFVCPDDERSSRCLDLHVLLSMHDHFLRRHFDVTSIAVFETQHLLRIVEANTLPARGAQRVTLDCGVFYAPIPLFSC